MPSELNPSVPVTNFARRHALTVFCFILLLLVCTGLAFYLGAFARFTEKHFERIQNGMHWTEVIMIMGCWPGEYRRPSARHTFQDPGIILDGGWTAQWDTDYGMFHVNFDPMTKRVRNKVFWP